MRASIRMMGRQRQKGEDDWRPSSAMQLPASVEARLRHQKAPCARRLPRDHAPGVKPAHLFHVCARRHPRGSGTRSWDYAHVGRAQQSATHREPQASAAPPQAPRKTRHSTGSFIDPSCRRRACPGLDPGPASKGGRGWISAFAGMTKPSCQVVATIISKYLFSNETRTSRSPEWFLGNDSFLGVSTVNFSKSSAKYDNRDLHG